VHCIWIDTRYSALGHFLITPQEYYTVNALLYCISEVKQQIPFEVLQPAFYIDELPNLVNLTSLDEKMMRKCIKARVLVDANIVRGIETIVPLNNIAPSYADDYYTVYQIPPEAVMNKEIMSALSLTYLPSQFFTGGSVNMTGNGTGMVQSFNATMNVANRIGSSASDTSVLSNAHLELVGYNAICVYAGYRQLASYGVRVVVENDNNFQNISPRSYKALSYLCVLAVKAYIYNKLIVKINMGYLQGGQELGQFKTILDSYESAEEEYRTYLTEKWRSIAYMNDTTSYNRFIRSMLSPGL